MKKYKVGVFIGRFQPFHLGHLEAIKQALQICDKLVIVIGSANKNFALDNPLTSKERERILELILGRENLRERILEVKILNDCEDNLLWMEQVVKISKKFEVVVGNNSLISVLAKYMDFPIFYPKLTKREKLQGKVIRKNILEGKKWQNLIPEYELELLAKFKIEERLKDLVKKDY